MENSGRWFAEAFKNADFIEIMSTAFCRMRLWDRERGLSVILETSASDGELGNAVNESLNASRILPVEEFDALLKRFNEEDKYGGWIRERMAQFGYKRKGQLFKRLHSCSIERNKEHIEISPSNHDHWEGWSGLDASLTVIIPPDSSAEEIGAALRLAFSRCMGKY